MDMLHGLGRHSVLRPLRVLEWLAAPGSSQCASRCWPMHWCGTDARNIDYVVLIQTTPICQQHKAERVEIDGCISEASKPKSLSTTTPVSVAVFAQSSTRG